MKPAWLIIAIAALAVTASQPASAREKHSRYHHRAPRHCVDRRYEFSWFGFLTNPRPEPNGCAPAVYQYGEYVGQDPDPNIRFQLHRDPASGYSTDLNN